MKYKERIPEFKQKKVKSGKVNRFPIGHLSSLEDLDFFSSNTQTKTSWIDVVYK